ncbi:MAG TPA: GTP-binding protein [Thermoplasmata archaeon]|nr:GTP-binding protein [Thermoplasmata archaeon]
MHKLAVALLGEAAVGKTSLVRRFVVDQFSDGYLATVGAKPMKKDLQVRVRADGEPEDVQLLVWDVVGQRGYHGVQDRVLKGIQGVLLVYDVTRDETRESLRTYWISRMKEAKLRVPVVIVGNKLDLSQDRWAGLEDLRNFARDVGSPGRHFLTSAKTGERVEDAFALLATTITGGFAPPALVDEEDPKARVVDPMVAVVDQVITDFCDEYGGPERAMFHVQREAARAGLNINAPNWQAVRLFIQNLNEIDRGLRVAKAADSQARRLQWLWEAANASPL